MTHSNVAWPTAEIHVVSTLATEHDPAVTIPAFLTATLTNVREGLLVSSV
jgi:hypothetical protein